MRKSCAKTGRANTMDSVVGKGGKGMFWHHEQMSPDRPCRPSWETDRLQQVPHLPHKSDVDVIKCHTCHAKHRPSNQARHQSQPGAHACHTKAPSISESTMPCHQVLPRKSDVPQVPRLPHKSTVHVRKCHTCHTKVTSMSPSAIEYFFFCV